MESTNAVCHLTFDIDWAPDWSVVQLLDELDRYHAQGTFFITHESDVVSEINRRGHGIGIHPNFLPNSSQGNSPLNIVDNLLKIAPNATALRTHALHQSNPLLQQIFTEFDQLKYDFSILMYKFPHLGWFDWKFGGADFKRINYNWEDDWAFYDENFDWSRFMPWSDRMIFDFHPIHLALNSCKEDLYNALKAKIGRTPLFHVTRDVANRFRSDKAGAFSYLQSILSAPVRKLTFEEIKCELE